MEEDTFVIKVNVQNKDNNVKVEKKIKDVVETDLEDELIQCSQDVIDLINK